CIHLNLMIFTKIIRGFISAEHEFLLSSSVEVANNILYESQCGVCQRSQAGNQAEHGITLGTKLINPAIATLD
ncbi:hypothetical protein, partial [Klebsiella pneumoniae]|uniref:hypothetical protein n=1 Tax=Klebsiella pneumoniae TaxID=573 RepID=UPI001EED0542